MTNQEEKSIKGLSRDSHVASGQAAIFLVVFLLVISLTIVTSFAVVTLREDAQARALLHAKESYAASEGGLEEVTYRVLNGKPYSLNEEVPLGNATTKVAVAQAGSDITITSSGNAQNNYRTTKAVLVDDTTGVGFFYGVQVGEGGLTMKNNAKVNGNIFSNGNITGQGSAAITGDVVVATGVTVNPTEQWTSRNVDFLFATTSASRDIAQSFTAPSAGALNKVSVFLGKAGSPSNLTLRITTDNSGEPNRTDIANSFIPVSSVGTTPSWIDVTFSSPPALTSGTKYWIVLDYGSNSTTNYWKWSMDSSDGYANNTGKYTTDWSDKNANWTNTKGDLNFRAWIGGVSNTLDTITVGTVTTGTAYADIFLNDTVHGAACPPPVSQGGSQYCIDNQSQSPQPLPISDGVIQDWKDEAAAGGTCGPPTCDSLGNLDLSNGASASLGPIKITGTLNMNNGGILTLTGTIWVVGDVTIKNSSIVKLASGYGSNSGVMVTDDDADVHNSVVFSGSGQAGSYIILLAAKNAPTSQIMSIDNGSTGVIYYAQNGRIFFHNSAAAKEATAYGIDMDNSSTITYESGLQSLLFSSGPSGGKSFREWREIP